MPAERDIQSKLIKRIKSMFPNAIVMKNDSSYLQGVPDLLVLNGNRWAALEVKKDGKASHRPNQDYYIGKMNAMSYAAFVSPENETEVLDDLQRALGTEG